MIPTFIQPYTLVMNFGFGVLPGWWLDQDDGVSKNSVVSEQQWNTPLRQHGFSGNKLAIPGVEEESSRLCGIIITTKAFDPAGHLPRPTLMLVVESNLPVRLFWPEPPRHMWEYQPGHHTWRRFIQSSHLKPKLSYASPRSKLLA